MTDEEKAEMKWNEISFKYTRIENMACRIIKDDFIKVYLDGLAEDRKEKEELKEQISVLLSCSNCTENKGGYICDKEYNDKCLAQKIEHIKELQIENEQLKDDLEMFQFLDEQNKKEIENYKLSENERKEIIAELKRDKTELTNSVTELKTKVTELENLIEKLKTCRNCNKEFTESCETCRRGLYDGDFDNWEFDK